ncbi:MAG: phosphate--acyl-ACP acyltransferase, partial [Oscillospiraceae bacterium]
MKIIVDGFGGDNSPDAVLEGCLLAMEEYGVEIIVTGDRDKLIKSGKDNNLDISRIEIVQAQTIMPVEQDPTKISTEYADSSMAVAFKLLAEGKGDAMVCAGST